MGRLIVFNMISLDGYFVDMNGEMRWAHNAKPDPEWDAFVTSNARGGGTLLFGRVTYQLMAGYWPTPMAAQNDPVVAERMNALPKVVFSRTLREAAWNNTRIVSDAMIEEVRRMKEDGGDMAIMGSGSLISRLTAEALIDEFQVAVIPIALGSGRTMFEGVGRKIALRLLKSHAYANGNVMLYYEPVN